MNINEIIGINLKRLRTERQLSLGQLAALCDVSKVILSQIERGESNPTCNTIWKIAVGLRVNYTDLLDYPSDNSVIVKKQDAVVQAENDGGYQSYSYFKPSPDRTFDLFVIDLLPGTEYTSAGHLVGSTEYVIINKGNVKIIVANNEYLLEEGDSFCFESDRSHTYVNIGKDIANCTTLINYR